MSSHNQKHWAVTNGCEVRMTDHGHKLTADQIDFNSRRRTSTIKLKSLPTKQTSALCRLYLKELLSKQNSWVVKFLNGKIPRVQFRKGKLMEGKIPRVQFRKVKLLEVKFIEGKIPGR